MMRTAAMLHYRRRLGLTKRLDQSGNSRMPRDQPRFQSTSISKSSRSAILVSPRTPRVKLTTPSEQKQKQRLPSEIRRIPNRWSGIRACPHQLPKVVVDVRFTDGLEAIDNINRQPRA